MCYKHSLYLKTSAWVAKQCARARSARAKCLCNLPQKTHYKGQHNTGLIFRRENLSDFWHASCAHLEGNWAAFYQVQTCPLLSLLFSLLPVLDGPSHQEQNSAKPRQACACPDKPPDICNSTGARRIHHESSNSHSQRAAGAGWPSTAMPRAQLGWGPHP